LMRKVCMNCAKEEEVTEAEQMILGADIKRVKRGCGCAQCNNTGYRRRIAIHEILPVDAQVRRMIANRVPTEDIENYARKELKMKTLRESAVEYVRAGISTMEELLKVTYN